MKRGVVLALLVVLVTACAQIQPRTKEQALQQEFRVGTEGLRAVFLPNLPPVRIFDTEPLSVTLQVENRGTARVGGPGDRMYLSGFDPSIITNIPTSGVNIPDLQPRDVFTPQGGVDHISFQGRPASLKNKGIDKYPARLQATLCYNYETVASANVCLDPNPYSATIQQKVCTPASVGLGGGQGAPVAVSMVELDPSLGKTRLRIRVQNVGGGEVFPPEALNKCSPFSEGLRFDEVDYVKVVEVRAQNKDIRNSCRPLTPDGHVRLTNGVGTLFCEITGLSGTAAFVSPIVAKLQYGYRTSMLKTVDIIPGS